MHRKSVSLALLGLVFGIGAMTADGPAVFAGSPSSSVVVTLAIVVLLALGVFFWSRIVKAAHDAQLSGEANQPAVSTSPLRHASRERLTGEALAAKQG